MNSTLVKLVYFSPTRTTQRVIEAIAQGVECPEVERVDLTTPLAMAHTQVEMQNDLAIIGCPVYGGRLPVDAVSRLRRLKGNGTPAVIVVVYGNRAYEDALLELTDLALEAGFRPIAAGAFIGEHSFSHDASPIAVGRPDANDLRRARDFGAMIRAKMNDVQALDEISALRVPGNFPYKERGGLSNVSPVTREAACSSCGRCAPVCPLGAITIGDTVATDATQCIRCCACVKSCADGARIMEDPRVRQVAEMLSANCRERKEPETYL